jgi:hypothetical protein
VRLAAVALAIMALLTPLHAAAAGKGGRASIADVLGGFSGYNAVTGKPLPGSDGYLAQDDSDRIFAALVKVLGGDAPKLQFVGSIPAAGGLTETHLEADPAANRINIDPYAMHGLVYNDAPTHSGAFNQMPHEMAHLRQTVTAVPDREGGAQAFADLVSPEVAALTHSRYDSTRNFDGAYADYVKAAQAKGRDWLLGTQFGHPAVAWP